MMSSENSSQMYRIILAGLPKDQECRNEIICRLNKINRIEALDFNNYHENENPEKTENLNVTLLFFISKLENDEAYRNSKYNDAKTFAKLHKIKCFSILFDISSEEYNNSLYWKDFPEEQFEESKLNAKYSDIIKELNQPIQLATNDIDEYIPKIYWRIKNYYSIIHAKNIVNNAEKSSDELKWNTNDLVFISSKSEDYEIAKNIQKYLQANEIKTFLAPTDLIQKGDANYLSVIDSQIEKCQHMIVVASSADHTRSRWVEYEWRGFVVEKLNGKKNGNLFSIVTNEREIQNLPIGLRRYESVIFNPKKDSFDDLAQKILPLININHKFSIQETHPVKRIDGSIGDIKPVTDKDHNPSPKIHGGIIKILLMLLFLIVLVIFSLFSGLIPGCFLCPDCCPPPPVNIEFTNVPPCGSSDKIVSGKITGIEKFSDYHVNLWIKVDESYWPKPYSATRNISIDDNGTWETTFITGGDDRNASEIVAALIPKDENIPEYAGSIVLPKELDNYPVAKQLRCSSSTG